MVGNKEIHDRQMYGGEIVGKEINDRKMCSDEI